MQRGWTFEWYLYQSLCISNGLVATAEVRESLMQKHMVGTQWQYSWKKDWKKGQQLIFWAIEKTGVEDVLKSAKGGESWCERLHDAIKNTSSFIWSDGCNNATLQYRPERSI